MKIIGREEELKLLEILIEDHFNVLVEGAVGVGKTTLILESLKNNSKKYLRIDGDARFTEEKLVGWFEPSKILKHGFSKESFVAGPLVECMQKGYILFINELNRLPEGVQNLLLPAMDEGEVVLNHLGKIKAKTGFCIVATQNPSEYIATSDISEALRDRFESITLKILSKEQKLTMIKNVLGQTDEKTAKLIYDFIDYLDQHPKVLNKNSLRILIGLAKVHTRLKSKYKDEEKLISTSLTVALKNRLNFVNDYKFEEFISDFLKKKK